MRSTSNYPPKQVPAHCQNPGPPYKIKEKKSVYVSNSGRIGFRNMYGASLYDSLTVGSLEPAN